jgi:putative SOS response-associated peptidase YedK
MCGRFTLTKSRVAEVALAMGPDIVLRGEGSYRPRYNVAPSNAHWIFRTDEEKTVLESSKWGLLPKWLERPEGFINARSESLLEKPAFRDAFRNRRCVIPADGFYEWTGTQTPKQPYWFHKPKNDVFLFAGLYEPTKEPPANAPPTTFTILTRSADGVVKRYHQRMPIILSSMAAKKWIASDHVETLLRLLQDHSDTALEATAVSKRVNRPDLDDPSCLEPG